MSSIAACPCSRCDASSELRRRLLEDALFAGYPRVVMRLTRNGIFVEFHPPLGDNFGDGAGQL